MNTKWTEFKLATSPHTSIPAYRKNFGKLGRGIIVPYNGKFDWSVFTHDSKRKPKHRLSDTADTFEDAKACVEAYFRGVYETEGHVK